MSRVYLAKGSDWYEASTEHEGFESLYNIRLMSYGTSHACIVQNDNELYGLGENKSGCLGVDEWDTSKNLKRIEEKQFEGRRITDIVCGGDYTILVLDHVELYGTGTNVDGAVGNDSTVSVSKFVKVNMTEVKPFKRITHLKTGYFMWGFVTDHACVYMCGYGNVGQMCRGAGAPFNGHPVPIISGDHLNDATIIDFACPSAHGILLTTKGLFTWGWNNAGQLGTNSTQDSGVLTQISTEIRSGFISSDSFRDATIIIKPDLQMFGCGKVNFMNDENQGYNPLPILTKSTHSLVKRAVNNLRSVGAPIVCGALIVDNIVYDEKGTVLLDLTGEEILLVGAGYMYSYIVTGSKPILNLGRMVGSRCFSDIDLK